MEPRELATTKSKDTVAFTLFSDATPIGDVEKIVFSFSKDQIETESTRIAALNQLHKLRTKSAWLIGEILLQEEAILTKRYADWLKRVEDGAAGPDEKYTQPRKLMHWIEANEDKLKFGTRQARRYIHVRQTTDKDLADKIGVKKLDIISQAPTLIQEDLKKKCVIENWSSDKLVNEVAKFKIKQAAEREYKKKVQPNLPKINIRLDSTKSNRIILEVAAKDRDNLNQILQEKYIDKIKEDLYFMSQN